MKSEYCTGTCIFHPEAAHNNVVNNTVNTVPRVHVACKQSINQSTMSNQSINHSRHVPCGGFNARWQSCEGHIRDVLKIGWPGGGWRPILSPLDGIDQCLVGPSWVQDSTSNHSAGDGVQCIILYTISGGMAKRWEKKLAKLSHAHVCFDILCLLITPKMSQLF